jgi:tetrahydromethanopterin S-methyltransferase subunit F
MGKHRLNGFLVQLSLRHQVGEQARLVERILDRLGHGAAAAFFAAGAAFAGAAGFLAAVFRAAVFFVAMELLFRKCRHLAGPK